MMKMVIFESVETFSDTITEIAFAQNSGLLFFLTDIDKKSD